jgi:hypothetical protein
MVKWGDAHVRAGWGHNEHEAAPVESLGFVVQHDKKGISIAKGRSRDSEDELYKPLTVEFIPNGMVYEVIEL